MLQILRRGQRWILSVVIVVVGGAFVFFLGIGRGYRGAPGPSVVVDVNGRRYDGRDFERVREGLIGRYRQLLGDSFDTEALRDRIDQEVSEALIQRSILAQEARRLGLTASDAEVRAYLRAIPGAVDSDGRIDEATVTGYAERQYGSVRRFQEWLREELLAQKASRLLRASVAVSPDEAREAFVYRQQQVRIAYLALDPASLASGIEVADEDVAAWADAHEAELRALYEERSDVYDRPEEVHARHILIRVPHEEGLDPEEADAQARAKAEAALERIRGGEPFEDVAAEVSEDPGSKTRGGDLGFFPRGRMVEPFENAAFSLEVGELSEPIKTVHGWHVIQVEERREAQVIPFEEARMELAREQIVSERAGKEADDLVAKVLEGISRGKSLTEAARERDLVLQRPDPIRRRPDGVIPGLGVNEEALAAIFGLTDEAPTLAHVYRFGEKRVLFERLGGSTPSEDEIEQQLETVRSQLLEERQATVERAWIEARRQALRASGDLVVNLHARRG